MEAAKVVVDSSVFGVSVFFKPLWWHCHARPEQVMQAVRHSTFGGMKLLVGLSKASAAALRMHDSGDFSQDKRVLDELSVSGFLFGGREHEIVMFRVWNVRANRRPEVRTLQQFADYREQGAVKMACEFKVQDAAADGPRSAPRRVFRRLTISPAAARAVTGN